MPKYIFKKNEYAKFVNKKYVDVPLKDPTGRKYSSRKLKWYTLPGDKSVQKLYGYTLGIYIGVNSFAPGGVYESHEHDTPTFYYVVSGKAKVRVGDEEGIVGPGTWVVTPPRVPHYLENIGKKPFTYITAETFHQP